MKIGLELIRKLKPAIFRYKPNHTEDNRKHFGFIAQDIAEILPMDEFMIVKLDDQGYHTLDHGQLVAPLVKAVQELSKQVEELEKKYDEVLRNNSRHRERIPGDRSHLQRVFGNSSK